jgi:hypothetical protein
MGEGPVVAHGAHGKSRRRLFSFDEHSFDDLRVERFGDVLRVIRLSRRRSYTAHRGRIRPRGSRSPICV